MTSKIRALWVVVVGIELIGILVIGYQYYAKKFGSEYPKNIRVTPISKDYVLFPTDTTLQYYDEPKANISTEEDVASIGLPSSKIIQTFNEDGLNERFDYSIKKSKGVYRIISLGDSFTQGAFVETKQNYSEVLEDMLNAKVTCPGTVRFEVINLGVLGYDMQYNLERFKRKGLKYDPDLVILWTNDNDYDVPSEAIRKFTSEWDPNGEAPELVNKYRALGDFYPEQTVLFNKFYETHPRNELIKEEAQYLREFVSLYSGPLVVFTVASFPQDIRSQIEPILSVRPNIHFYPEIPDDFDKLPDQHPSPVGHQQFATFLFTKLATLTGFLCQKP